VVSASLAACGSDEDHRSTAPVAVLATFPAELAALLEQTTVEGTMVIEGRTFRFGSLGGMPVVVGMTGIGLTNAAVKTAALLDSVEVRGVIVSGVGGSPRRIGDVTVPLSWSLAGGAIYDVDRRWARVADEVAGGMVELETCTEPPSMPDLGTVCVPHVPAIFVGGTGQSSDPFPSVPYGCQRNGDDVFGCDVVPTGLETAGAGSGAGEGSGEAVAVDMETAAIAGEAALRDLPFIAFRAVSDGEGDPLHLPGFPDQFFAYYRLAAHNAAAATVAFLERLSR
jgi:nucleoside phosphorylase